MSFTNNGNCSKLLNSSDEFLFDFSDLIEYARNLRSTKRSVLQVTAKIFDTLGFLSPFLVRLKILFRDLCTDKVDWDESLHGEVLEKWNAIVAEIGSLSCLKLPRCYYLFKSTPLTFQLHGFSDASSLAYGAVLYFKTVYVDGSVTVGIVAAKTQVSPVKSQTIPRLELIAALILSRLAVTVHNSLEPAGSACGDVSFDRLNCCSLLDKQSQTLEAFLSSRVDEIHKHTSGCQWRHSPGHLNPADMPSHGLSGSEQ